MVDESEYLVDGDEPWYDSSNVVVIIMDKGRID